MEQFLPLHLRQSILQNIELIERSQSQITEAEEEGIDLELAKQQLSLAKSALKVALVEAMDRATLFLINDEPCMASPTSAMISLSQMAHKVNSLLEKTQCKNSSEEDQEAAMSRITEIVKTNFTQICPRYGISVRHEPEPDSDFDVVVDTATEAPPSFDEASHYRLRPMFDVEEMASS